MVKIDPNETIRKHEKSRRSNGPVVKTELIFVANSSMT